MNELNNKVEMDSTRLNSFKKTLPNMIATSETSYQGDSSFNRVSSYIPYTKEEALRIINSGDSDALRELSLSFLYSSGFYRRMISYYASFLKYSTIIIPHLHNEKTIKDKKYSKKYYDSLNFYNLLNFESLCTDFSFKVLSEGSFYGILMDYGKEGVNIQPLPFSYARSRFQTLDKVNIVEIDLSYFDTIRDKKKRDECLASYPIDVKKAYNKFKNSNGSKWYQLAPGVGVHFKLFEERPFLLNVIPAIIDFDEYREIEKEKDTQELKKIVVQEMPHTSDGELVFEPEEVEVMHQGTVGMLKKNKDVSVLTSFGKISLESLTDTRNTITNNLEKIEKTIYSEAGVSKQLFSADGNLSLTHSIENDLAIMMVLAESFTTWLSYLLNVRYGDNNLSFSAKILPVSYYNTNEYITKGLEMAQYGYSFLIPAVATGINQSEITDLKSLEIDLLNLHEELIPLQSSHTQSSSGNEQPLSDKGKTNNKEETEKSDRTLENEQSLEGGGN